MGRDPYKYFRVEARELLDDLTRLVLELDRGTADRSAVAKLLRIAHTLKGAAHVVKQTSIADAAHAIEDVLYPYRESDGPVPKPSTSEALRLLDQIGANLKELAPSPEPGETTMNHASSLGERLETVRVEVEDVEALLSSLSEAAVQVTAIRNEAGALKEIKQLASAIAGNFSVSDTRQNGTGALRVRAKAEQLVGSVARVEQDLVSAIERTERELLESQERAHRLRLLPVEIIFPFLGRALHEVAQALGKQVELQTSGADVRLDADVLAVLQDALLQLVRNAVAHGIETQEIRTAGGKPSLGKVEVRVERRGGRVAFVCRDDGAGIDVGGIRKAAVRKGAISEPEAQSLGLNEAINLILHGGVSTTRTVTTISGRGIGLDMVRDAVARLKGDISVDTATGVGTTVEICVPVSLNSVSALLVESAGIGACIPLESVRQTLRIVQQDIARAGESESIPYNNQAISFLPLSHALGRPSLGINGCERKTAVVVAFGDAVAAVGVEKLLGTRSILAHSLPSVVAADPIVAGGTLDAAGNPLLVIDPAGLVQAVQRGRSKLADPGKASHLPVLVIDDSLTTRMVEQNVLESAGHPVELASSAEEALEMARAHRYGLFLVDVEMPGMDGFQFLARTREDPLLRGIPSILVSSRNSVEDRRRGDEVGARAYIAKGEFDQRSFLATVTELLE
jgi:two-component system chemotaxis sensor kinase CheA